jgi:hypothetical protein
MAKVNLWFGVAYVALAVVLLCILIFTRHHTSRPKKASTNKSTGGARAITPADNIYGTDPLERQPKFDTKSPNLKTAGPTKTSKTAAKPTRRRPPPGLIQ